jgi:hypothetical protein
MRTFNGLQIFTEQLTNTGQLDLRYVRLTGSNTFININNGLIINQYGTPTGEYSPGYSGQIAVDENNIYICTSGNGTIGKWKYLSLIDYIPINLGA